MVPLSESSSSKPPSPVSSLSNFDSSHPKRPTDKRDYFFIDVQADISQNSGVGRRKKAFLTRNSHQKRKQASVDRLRSSQYPSGSVSQDDRKSQEGENQENPRHIQTTYDMRSLTAMGEGYVDPFCTFSVPMTDSMNMYLHHYKVHIVASYYPPDATRIYTWWLQKAIASPVLLQSIISLAAGHKASLESNQGVSSRAVQKLLKDSIYFRINSIRSLNDLLQDPVTAVTEPTILLVCVIVTAEALNADFNALKAHIKGLRTLVSLRGGINAVNHMTLSRIYRGDTMSAALQIARPSFPMLAEFHSKTLQQSNMFHSSDTESKYKLPAALAALGTRFAKAPWYTEINSYMKYLLKVFQQLVRHFEIATLSPNIVTPADMDLFVIFQHQLLSICHTPESDDLNEVLSLSLLIYSYLRVTHFQSFQIMRYMVENLRKSLTHRLSYLQATCPDLLFWILCIGGMASERYSSRPWFVLHLTNIAQNLELKEWVKVRTLLEEFFYTDQPGDTAAEDLWNEVSPGSSDVLIYSQSHGFYSQNILRNWLGVDQL